MPDHAPPQQIEKTLFRQKLFTVLVIVALVATAYSNTLDASWHFDDEQNIVENQPLHLTELTADSIAKTFFASPNGRGELYRPVACFSFALNYYFGKTRVFGYHLVNLAVHATASVFLFLFLCRVLRLPLLRKRTGKSAPLIAALATLLWALNPVQTQAVTYIVQRMASMAGMFTIMAMYFYLRGRTAAGRGTGAYLLCGVFGILAVGSKENAAMLPFSLLLFDLLLVQGVSQKSLRTAAFVLPLLILLPAAAALVLKGPSFFDLRNLIDGYRHRGFSLGQRLLTEPGILLLYLTQIFAPSPGRLSLVHPVEPSTGLFEPPTTALSILAILAMIGAAAVFARKRPLFSFAVFFFFLNHLVESTILPLELVYEHRNYLPSMFLFAPPAAWIVSAADRAKRRWIPTLIFAATALAISGFGYGTYMRNFDWKSEEALWLDAIAKHPTSARAYHNLGRHYAENRKFLRARYAYNLALKQPDPTYGMRRHVTHYNLAAVYQALEDPAAAETHLRRSIALKPTYAEAYTNLSLIVAGRGAFEEAEALLKRAVAYDPELQQAYTNLGYMRIKLDRPGQAIATLEKSLAMNPSDTKALHNLGIAYKMAGDLETAAACFSRVLFKEPRAAMSRLFLVEVRVAQGKTIEARQILELFVDLFTPGELSRLPRLLVQSGPLAETPSEALLAPMLEELLEKG